MTIMNPCVECLFPIASRTELMIKGDGLYMYKVIIVGIE